MMEEFGQGLARLRHVLGYMVSTHEPGAPVRYMVHVYGHAYILDT